VLELGPLHAEVQAHIKKVLDALNLFFEEDMSLTCETATLDGKPWEDVELGSNGGYFQYEE
jgi:hypothetical protein